MNEVGDTAMRKAPMSSAENAHKPRSAQPGDRPAHRPVQGAGPDCPDGLWDVTDASLYLHMPVSSVYRMTARKARVRIPHIRIGGKLRFRRADIDRWLALLTISNIDTLAKVRQRVLQVTHADHSQTASR